MYMMHLHRYVPRLAHPECNISYAALHRWITRRWLISTICCDRRSTIWPTAIWRMSCGYKRLFMSRWVVSGRDECPRWHFLSIRHRLRALRHSRIPSSKRPHPLKIRCSLPVYQNDGLFQVLSYRWIPFQPSSRPGTCPASLRSHS